MNTAPPLEYVTSFAEASQTMMQHPCSPPANPIKAKSGEEQCVLRSSPVLPTETE
jgi:hypothetical protein